MADWTPPTPLPDAPGGIRGAYGGTALFEQGRHAHVRARVDAFVAGDARLAVEVGFDHGMRILDHARRWPEIRWLGVELRQRRVDAVQPHAPPNCLLLRLDARTLFSALLPAGRVSWVYVLFPTPSANPKHVLFSPPFVASIERALAPDGVLHVATDVKELYDFAASLLDGWPDAPTPPMGPVLSRRERVCARDGLPVYRLSRGRPEGAWTGRR